MHGDGIRVVIGPYSSAEVQAVRDFANGNGVVLMSPLSTATSLAIPGDNIYRFTPDDQQEGAAVAALAHEDGVRTIIPVSRDDPGNLGLQSSMKTAYEAMGGTIVSGITYAASESNFQSVVESLAGILRQQPQDGSTAIYLTAFSEVTSLFAAASDSADAQLLHSTRWYGSDSVAQSKDLIDNAKAAAFAVEAEYPNPILGLREADKSLWEPVSGQLMTELGRTPDSFALAAYDAFMVATTAMKGVSNPADAKVLGSEIVRVASGYRGLTGPATLNAAGDRSEGSYDFWAVCPNGSSFTWVRVISVTASAGGSRSVQRVSSCS